MSEFLAEAKVLIRPDTTTFRRELLTQIQAAVASVQKTVPSIKIPVVASAASAQATQQLTNETKKAAAAQQVLGAKTEELTVAQRRQVSQAGALRRSEALLASANQQQATLTLSQVTATSAVAKARADLSAATAVTRTATRANEAAMISENKAAVASTEAFLRNAQAREAAALATYQQTAASEQAARSAARQEGRRELAARGAGSVGLTALGARGATLAASGQFLAGAAIAVGVQQSIKLAANFEKQLNVLRATSGATGEELNAVAAEARALGRDVNLPGVSAGDAAAAMTELSKAGLDVRNSIAGARGVLQLATAAQIETAEATELTANALNAFGLAGNQATRVADVLANASVAAQGEIVDVGLALKQSATVARQVGLSLEDTVSLLALLAKNGLSGSDAGTSLRTALIRLDAPTDKAAERLAKLNVRIRDTQGNIRPEAFAELGVALQDLSVSERALARRDIFGQDAIRAFSVFSREGVRGLREMQSESAKTGTSLELAGAQTQGFTGKLENLKNQAEAVGGSLGSVLLGPLGKVIDTFAGGLGGVASFTQGIIGAAEALEEFGQKDLGPIQGGSLKGILGDVFDIGTELGKIPLKGGVVGVGLQKALGDSLERLGPSIEDKMRQATEDIGPAITPNFRAAGFDAREAFLDTFGERQFGLSGFLNQAALDAVPAAASAGSTVGRAFAEAFKAELTQASLAVGRLSAELLDVQFRGGSREEELGVLRSLRAQQEAQVAALEARAQGFRDAGQKAPDQLLKKIEEAKTAAIQTQAQIDAILASIASDQESAARDADKRKQEIQDARDEADKAILDALSGREERIEARIAGAELTKGLKDDVRFALQMIQDPKVRAAALTDLAKKITSAKEQVVEAYRDIADAREEERKAREDARIERLELDVQIAEATGNQAAQVRAQQVLVSDLQRRFNLAKQGSIERKRLKLALEQERAELRELKEEVEKRNNAFAELSFAFLQTQQGFAANLLGNLIPGSATSGLVGNVSPPTAGGRGGFVYPGVTQPNVGPGAIDQGIANQGALQAGARSGPTAGQMATLIQINQRMLTALEGVKRGAGHPEARHSKAMQTGGQDFTGYV